MTVYSKSVLAKKNAPTKVPVEETPKVAKKQKLSTPAVPAVPAVTVEKEKKPRTEKQLAADEKRREAMAAKKLLAHNDNLKKLYAEKPKKEVKNTTVAPKTIKPKIRPPAKTIQPDENVPPAWFNQWITKVKSEENKTSEAPRPKAEVKIEAQQIASEKWQDSDVRQKVEKAVSSHQQRMYNMMFKR